MKMACDLEVDVNGEETFFVDKEILSSFCGRLSELFSKPSVMETAKTLKVVLHELPGGAEAFELITRFCYGGGRVKLNPTNTCILHCAAHFMDMNKEGLIKETEKSLEGISYWMWTEVIHSLKQCQDFILIASSSGVLDKVLDSLVGRIATPVDASPTSSSPESSGFRFSFDTRSTFSGKIGHYRTWWFEDLTSLSLQMVEKVVELMIQRKFDHVSIGRFLLYYLKVSLANSTPEEKRKTTEAVVDLLYSLDRSSVPCKSLFGILRGSSSQNLSKLCRNRLESMIGMHIDQVTLDNLLVPAPTGTESLYDVNLVLRFLQFFLDNGGRKSVDRVKKVGSLTDLYLTEVAPDSGLKPLKFIALASILPDEARDCNDALYRAIDMYLEVHTRLSEEEKMKICCSINYEKLSSETCKHLAQNSKFPSRTAIQALVSQHSKLKNLLKDTNNLRLLGKGSDSDEQIILYAKKLDLSTENEKLRANLEGMQWKVMELEKVCRKMQVKMAKMAKAKLRSNRKSSRSLPKLCS
ncbi:uncharacterized protein A4U43_C03F9100 [Asparagus officinalis]|uniref:NPH3 domain-containing protein n=1 Tax=Asparagus officinalis TaxID=4686 RepID=A0A5P1F8I0_ASPOF|nr:BTB/POZ domain-containing protein At3g22104-like [Asparagus officinalis]XP_020256476.1 BTB/POZ domain-containing protein At3g22104-like [Asparagus officinalis]ONK74686.1 uncharacterized protein A4U43_C03F9100 [Asparagus officinalis]